MLGPKETKLTKVKMLTTDVDWGRGQGTGKGDDRFPCMQGRASHRSEEQCPPLTSVRQVKKHQFRLTEISRQLIQEWVAWLKRQQRASSKKKTAHRKSPEQQRSGIAGTHGKSEGFRVVDAAEALLTARHLLSASCSTVLEPLLF
jgi:hypothetical protein